MTSGRAPDQRPVLEVHAPLAGTVVPIEDVPDQAFAQKYDGQVKVIGVDFQETRDDRAQALIRRTGVRYPLFSDPDGKLRANALPKVLLVDEDGRVAYEAYVEITSLAQLEKLVDQHLGGA